MSGRRDERGQALVGVLVALAIILGLAGGLTVATSALLDQNRLPRSLFNADVNVRNAVYAAAAPVAGSSTMCSPPQGASLTLNLPANPDPFQSVAACLRIAGVDLSGGPLPVAWRQTVNLRPGACQGIALPGAASAVTAWFTARWSTGSGPLRVALANGGDCDDYACPYAASSEAVPGISQASISCDFTSLPSSPWLNLTNLSGSTQVAIINVRYAPLNAAAPGTLYMLAAQGTASSWEEADLSVPPSGGARFLYEAPL